MTGLEISLAGAGEQPAWDSYVMDSPQASVCHLFAWRAIIERTYGHRSFYLIAREAGTVRGLLPMFWTRSLLFGKAFTSLPFLDYGGVCADNDEICEGLVGRALALMRDYATEHLELRQLAPSPCEGRQRLDKVSMILNLPPGTEDLWRSFPTKVRNQVRKAVKSDLTTCAGGTELLEEFYKVFAVNMRDLGSPVHHKDFFTNIFLEFKDRARVMLVRDGSIVVGGLVALFFKDTVLAPWASSLRSHFAKCPNTLLYWDLIRYACEAGFQRFDFGRSSVGSGTFNFKRQWGANPTQLHWITYDKKGGNGSTLSSDDSKYRLAVYAWKHLPLSLTCFIGPKIRKYLTN